ncbi:hypothetical protein AMTRI_Chr04g184030 [Amborella trichopoda]|uniref:Uncharacterized protein n=1 Tax=Amborella trichopoda TaxID=13333 RepID=W1NPF7_AMBTC|nr:uncharacterized protein LOC18424777 [Amborella trichopoda]ERM96830.1 hypothetical protein AMTR_s00128p00093480 [Amborella trichopoda]|eukprot:XP_006829414.1 uncharacterized protein LOC18424777 [Amborella trichopoda]
MEVVAVRSPPRGIAGEFQFESGCSTPYASAPSSPGRMGSFFYFSAPTSPSSATSIFSEFHGDTPSATANVPFVWEQKPGIPKNEDKLDDESLQQMDNAFEFDFSGRFPNDPAASLPLSQKEPPSETMSTADELFHEGKIRPLKPPPRLDEFSFNTASSSPHSPRSPRSPIAHGRKLIREALSGFNSRSKDFDPFAAALERATKGEERGRSARNSSRRTRSLSPLRIFNWEEPHVSSSKPATPKPGTATPSPKTTTTASSSFSWMGSKKWKLKDFLLFRSASEGRAQEKDPLRKYRVLEKKVVEDPINSSFRSTDSGGGSSRRGGGGVSPHALHYNASRAFSEELRKKTFLPYRQGLFGCLGYSPTIHGLARGFR